MEETRIETDVLVLGAGAAGLMAAIEARRRSADVLLLCKKEAGLSGCTPFATANITCTTPDSEPELFRQMVEVGGFLNHQDLLEVFVREAAGIGASLRSCGVPLRIVDGSHYHLENYPDGPRGDLPGIYNVCPAPQRPLSLNLSIPLRETAQRLGARIVNRAMATSIIVVDGRAAGALALNLADGRLLCISANAVVLATGGSSRLYARTDNPADITGDGFALAFRAGAELADMELTAFNPLGLAPAVREMIRRGVPDDAVAATAMAHYNLGGVVTDGRTETTVAGLFAAGEVADGPLGAARLGGTALANAIVFGAVAGREAATRAAGAGRAEAPPAAVSAEKERIAALAGGTDVTAAELRRQIRGLMWSDAGVAKTEQGLSHARARLSELKDLRLSIDPDRAGELGRAVEAHGMASVAELIVVSSLERRETRGQFWRLDHPGSDNGRFLSHIVLRRRGDAIDIGRREVVMTRLRTPPAVPFVGCGCSNYLAPAAATRGAAGHGR